MTENIRESVVRLARAIRDRLTRPASIRYTDRIPDSSRFDSPLKRQKAPTEAGAK